jgi:hypothetical protein
VKYEELSNKVVREEKVSDVFQRGEEKISVLSHVGELELQEA